MLITESLGLAQADTIYNASMIELIRDDCIFSSECGFEEASIGVESTWIQDGVLQFMEVGNLTFKLLMNVLSATDKAH